MSLTNKYHKHIACSYGYKLLRVDDTFGKPFKSYLGEVSVYNFINSMIKKNKNVAVMWWKNILTKNLWWLKKTLKILRTLLNVRIVIMTLLIHINIVILTLN